MGGISTKKYQEDALRFCKQRDAGYGIEYFLKQSAQFLKSEADFIWGDAVLQGWFDKYLYLSLGYYHLASLVAGKGCIRDGCKHLQDAMYIYGK